MITGGAILRGAQIRARLFTNMHGPMFVARAAPLGRALFFYPGGAVYLQMGGRIHRSGFVDTDSGNS